MLTFYSEDILHLKFNVYARPCLQSNSAATHLQELLQKVNFNAHNFYYYSPAIRPKKGKKRSKAGGVSDTETEEEEDSIEELVPAGGRTAAQGRNNGLLELAFFFFRKSIDF